MRVLLRRTIERGGAESESGSSTGVDLIRERTEDQLGPETEDLKSQRRVNPTASSGNEETYSKEEGDPIDVEDVADPSLLHREGEVTGQIFRRLSELQLNARIRSTVERARCLLEYRIELEIRRPNEIEIIIGEEKRDEDAERDDERNGGEDDVVNERVGFVGGGTSRGERRRFRAEIAAGDSSPSFEGARPAPSESAQSSMRGTRGLTGEEESKLATSKRAHSSDRLHQRRRRAV